MAKRNEAFSLGVWLSWNRVQGFKVHPYPPPPMDPLQNVTIVSEHPVPRKTTDKEARDGSQ